MTGPGATPGAEAGRAQAGGGFAHLPVVDIHVHVIPWEVMTPGAKALLQKGRDAEGLARLREISYEPGLLIELMDKAGVSRLGLIGYVSPDVMGYPREINEWIARYVAAAPDRLFGHGSVHPRFSENPGADMDHVIGELGLSAIKIHPSHQLFAPNAYREGLAGLRAIYEKAVEHGVPVVVHTGTSTFPRARTVLADPLLVEDVAIDFPELVLILAHGGRPFWTEQASFLVRRFPNVYLDVSSIPPQHLLTRYFPRLEAIAGKTLYGSDWAGPGVPHFGELAQACRELPLPPDALRAILSGNAHRLFRLDRHGRSDCDVAGNPVDGMPDMVGPGSPSPAPSTPANT